MWEVVLVGGQIAIALGAVDVPAVFDGGTRA